MSDQSQSNNQQTNNLPPSDDSPSTKDPFEQNWSRKLSEVFESGESDNPENGFEVHCTKLLKEMPQSPTVLIPPAQKTEIRQPNDTSQEELLAGRFVLKSLLGRGGMGEVWLADDSMREDEVVIKVLPTELREDPVELARVRENFRRVNALHHNHICPLYDMGEDKGYGCFLVMKYIPGVTLKYYRWAYVQKHGHFPTEEVIRILGPVAEALDYAHSQQVVHRDIKPQNILIREDGTDPKLVDFGLATEILRSVGRVTNTRIRIDVSGTYPYMSPEQWRGQAQDGRTDQYALAVLAYELIAGEPPFDIVDVAAHKLAVLNDPVPESEHIPEAMYRSLTVAMSKDREQRYPSCCALIEAMESAQHGKLQLPSPTIPTTKPSGRSWFSISGLIAVLLGLIACLLLIFLLYQPMLEQATGKSTGTNTNAQLDKKPAAPEPTDPEPTKPEPTVPGPVKLKPAPVIEKKVDIHLLANVWELDSDSEEDVIYLELTKTYKSLLISSRWKRESDREAAFRLEEDILLLPFPPGFDLSDSVDSKPTGKFRVKTPIAETLILHDEVNGVTHTLKKSKRPSLIQSRKVALQTREQLKKQQASASSAKAESKSPKLWKEAETLSKQGNTWFAQLHFSDAHESWSSAINMFQKAEKMAKLSDQPVPLALSLEPGKPMQQEIVRFVNETKKKWGDEKVDIAQKEILTRNVVWTPIRKFDNGNWLVAFRMKNLKITIEQKDKTGNYTFSYDSEKDNGQDQSLSAKVYRAYSHIGLTYLLDPKGKVLKVTGQVAFIKAQEPNVQRYLEPLLDPELLESCAFLTFGWQPSHPVVQGETWSTNQPSDQTPFGHYNIRKRFTYEGLKDKLDYIDIEMDYQKTGKSFPVQRLNNKTIRDGKHDKIRVSGEVYFDRNKGRVAQAQLKYYQQGTYWEDTRRDGRVESMIRWERVRHSTEWAHARDE